MDNIIDFSKNPPAIVSGIVKKILDYKTSGSVLDLGSGIGRHSLFLAKQGFEVTALDTDKEALVVLGSFAKEERVNLVIKQADFTTFIPDHKYDIVLAFMSLNFLEESQIPKVINQMKNYTNNNGLHVIAVHTIKNIIKKHTRPHLFEENELRNYYKNWEILYYRELWGAPFRKRVTDKPVSKHRAELIARKK